MRSYFRWLWLTMLLACAEWRIEYWAIVVAGQRKLYGQMYPPHMSSLSNAQVDRVVRQHEVDLIEAAWDREYRDE